MVDQTPALKSVIDELEKRLGSRYSGYRTPQVIRPKIVGGKEREDLGWSQHSYRNASDIFAIREAQKPITDELARMRQQGYPVGVVLDHNYNADHWNHVHVEGTPVVTGNPRQPETWNIRGGTGEVASGPTGTATTEDDPKSKKLFGGIGSLNLLDIGAETIYRLGFAILASISLILTIIIIIYAFKGEELKTAAKTALGAAGGPAKLAGKAVKV